MKSRHVLPPTWCRSRTAWAAAHAALVSAALVTPCVHAQMADPMRPAFGSPANRPQANAYVSPNLPLPGSGAGRGPGSGPGSGQAHSGAPPGGAPTTAPGSPRLSSVMVGPPTVACAVIDGQVVRVGERIRGDRGEVLVQVDRLGVLLRSSQGSTRLNLMSRIELPAAAMPTGPAAPEVAASNPNAPPANATPPADTPGVARKETP
jgi:hypothetical protein